MSGSISDMSTSKLNRPISIVRSYKSLEAEVVPLIEAMSTFALFSGWLSVSNTRCLAEYCTQRTMERRQVNIACESANSLLSNQVLFPLIARTARERMSCDL